MSKRVSLLTFGFFCMMLLGLVYAWSIFSDHLSLVFGYSPDNLSSVFGVLMVFFCVGCLAASYTQKAFGVCKALSLSAFFVFLGFSGTALTAQMGILFVYICYGVFVGLGCGFGYNTIVSSVNRWFPDKIGFSSGVLLLGYGSGSLVFGVLVHRLMDSALGCSKTLFLVGVILGLILFVSSRVIKSPECDISSGGGNLQRGRVSKESFNPIQMIKSRIFHFQVVWYICAALAPVVLLGTAKQGAVSVGLPSEFAVLLVGVVSVANGASRVVYGAVYDRLGLVAVMGLCSILAFAGCVAIFAAYATDVPSFYTVGSLVLGLAYGGAPICSSTFSMSRFGRAHYASNYAIATSCMIPTAAIQASLVPVFAHAFGGMGQYCILSFVSLVSLVVLVPFARIYRREMDLLA